MAVHVEILEGLDTVACNDWRAGGTPVSDIEMLLAIARIRYGISFRTLTMAPETWAYIYRNKEFRERAFNYQVMHDHPILLGDIKDPVGQLTGTAAIMARFANVADAETSSDIRQGVAVLLSPWDSMTNNKFFMARITGYDPKLPPPFKGL